MKTFNKEVFFCEDGISDGKPSYFRLNSFKDFFIRKGYVSNKNKNKSHYVFISMPPFKNFKIFFSLNKKVILDIRDGWSIAQKSGYGGSIKKKPLKAWVTCKVERFIIRRSFITITCTPGLKEYLESISGRRVILIPNGISEERIQLINELKIKKSSSVSMHKKNTLVFACSGQFSEYGVGKVKELLSTIVGRYGAQPTEIRLIGASKERNLWIVKYYSDLSRGLGTVTILPRMNEEELFENMLEADYGLSIIRDPDYEFGTKIYDYIALGIPVVNYFNEPNKFTEYFDACLDKQFNKKCEIPEINRHTLIERGLENVKF